jgi:hypothetical protein
MDFIKTLCARQLLLVFFGTPTGLDLQGLA